MGKSMIIRNKKIVLWDDTLLFQRGVVIALQRYEKMPDRLAFRYGGTI